jgi:hypothetical protein
LWFGSRHFAEGVKAEITLAANRAANKTITGDGK